jgi:hypothetical protein
VGCELKKPTCPAELGKRRMIRFENLKPFDLRMQRTPTTGLAESGHGMLGPGKDRLDIAIVAITHPTRDAASLGVPLRESTKANALHAAADPHTDDFFYCSHADRAAGIGNDPQSCFFLKSAT